MNYFNQQFKQSPVDIWFFPLTTIYWNLMLEAYRWSCRLNFLSHVVHTNLRSSLCVSLCLAKALVLLKTLWHRLHSREPCPFPGDICPAFIVFGRGLPSFFLSSNWESKINNECYVLQEHYRNKMIYSCQRLNISVIFLYSIMKQAITYECKVLLWTETNLLRRIKKFYY